MPRAAQDKPYVRFSNGFITEASGLNFPEGSVQDIDNCNIQLDGSVRRRFGLDQESGGTPIQFQRAEGINDEDLAYSTHQWDNADGDSSRKYVVIQVGNTLLFRNENNEALSSPNVLDSGGEFSLDISDFVRTPSELGTNAPFFVDTIEEGAKFVLQSSSGVGRLWMTSQAHFPFYLEYNSELDVFQAFGVGKSSDPNSSRTFYIRDFNGVEDGLAVDTQPSTLSKEHLYNLLNQGWPSDKIKAYYDSFLTGTKLYPANSQQWLLGKKDSDDTFDGELLRKQDFGNSPAPKGRAKIDPLVGSKDNIFTHTFTPDIPSPLSFDRAQDESSLKGWKCVAFFAGRVAFAGDVNKKRPNGIYISKIITKPADAGVFGQENDPTSEHYPDLLPSDGLVVYIPEAESIELLSPFLDGLLVFARNAVWFIRGSDASFSATNYSVDKISTTGCLSPNSIVKSDKVNLFFAKNSIHAVSSGNNYPVVEDIAEQKILKFYNSIPLEARAGASSVFDTVSKKAMWLYSDNPFGGYKIYNHVLLLDLRTGAFTKHSFYSVGDDTREFGIIGAVPNDDKVNPKYQDTVVVGSDAVVVGSETVTSGAFVFDTFEETVENNVKFLVVSNEYLQTGSFVHICDFNSLEFLDFLSIPNPTGNGVDYQSYVIPAPETLGDLQRNKQATYVHSFFKRTEKRFSQLTPDAPVDYDRPSGCFVTGVWDWQVGSSNKRWSTPTQAYKPKGPKPVFADQPALPTTEGIVYSKVKVRGKGRSLAVKYSSETGKDFVLLGFSSAITANGV